MATRRFPTDRPGQDPRGRAAVITHVISPALYDITFDDGGRGPGYSYGGFEYEVGDRVRGIWSREITAYEIFPAVALEGASPPSFPDHGTVAVIGMDAGYRWRRGSSRNQVSVDAQTTYIFGILGNALVYLKSTDGGETFESPVTVRSSVEGWDIYHSRWTDPAGAGVVHIVTGQAGGARQYLSLDLSDDSLGTPVNILGGTSGTNDSFSIGLARNGNLVACGAGNAGAWTHKSTDDGATWSAIATITEAQADKVILWPDFDSADEADMLALFWDASAEAITVKRYDDSLDSITEISALSSVDSFGDSDNVNWGSTLSPSTGAVSCIAISSPDAPADIKAFTVLGSTVTVRTDVLSSTSHLTGAAMAIDAENGRHFAFYGRDRDSASYSSIDILYKVSDDDMVTWSDEQVYGIYDDQLRHLGTDPIPGQIAMPAVTMGAVNTFLYVEEAIELDFTPVVPDAPLGQLDSSEVTHTDSVPANWSGDPPTTVEEALRRLALFVEAQHGAIP